MISELAPYEAPVMLKELGSGRHNRVRLPDIIGVGTAALRARETIHMRKPWLAGMALALGCAIASSANAQAPSGTLPTSMMQCLLHENMNWYQNHISNTNALDDCYVIGADETAKAIRILGKLQDNGTDSAAASPWIRDHCEPRGGGYLCLAHGISVWFPNDRPTGGAP
jgi:hypothetical protein